METLAREILVASALVLQDRLPLKEDMNRVLLQLLYLSEKGDDFWQTECISSNVKEELSEFFKLFTAQVDFEALKAVNVLALRDSHPYGQVYRQFVDLHHGCFVRYCRIVEAMAADAGLDIDSAVQELMPPVLRLKTVFQEL